MGITITDMTSWSGLSMDISALGFLTIALCSLLFACSWVLQFNYIWVSWWKSVRTASCGGAALPLPPGSFGIPWLGETVQFNNALQAGDLQRFLQPRTARFRSKTFKTHIFLKPTAVVQGAAANRFIAASENQHLLVASWAPSVLRIVGPHAPAAKKGAAHRRLRHIMNSCLGPLALRKLVGKADLLTRHHFASCWQGRSQLALFPLLKLHTFRVACSLLASIEDEAVISHLYPLFNTWLAGMVALPINLPGTAFNKALKARTALITELREIIHRRRQDLAQLEHSHSEQGGSVAPAQPGHENNVGIKYTEDLLSMFIKARDADGGALNQEELEDVLLFMLFAGHDTTTAALAFALKFLEQNPSSYDSLVQEHESIASQKQQTKELEWEDVQEMKFTWRVIQETMRIMPPVFGGLKEATQDLTFDGYRIPKGWKMFFIMITTHHDEQYFPIPTKFDPSRFDSKKRQGESTPPPFSYVPFGIGPHSCPGNEFARMTSSIYLHHLARHFTWTSVEPNEKVCIFPLPSLAKGYPAKINEKLS